MPIRFRCIDCNQLLSIASRKAGAQIRCPRCDTENMVPSEDRMVDAAQTLRESAVTDPPHADLNRPGDSGGETLKSSPGVAPVVQGTSHRSSQPASGSDDDLAPAFNVRRAQTEFDDMDLTPMVDVTFLLLIFFMITASFTLQKTIPIPSPDPDEQGATENVQPLDELLDGSLRVEIDENNVVTVEDEPVPDLSRLIDVMREQSRDDGKRELLLIPDKQSSHRTTVAVVDAGNALDMRIRIADVVGDDPD